MKIAAIVMALILTSTAVLADSRGGDLNASCTSTPGTKGDLICRAYLNGYLDGVTMDQITREQRAPICIPDHTSTDQMREAVMNFAKAHPDTLYFGSPEFVAAALMQAFPCKNSN